MSKSSTLKITPVKLNPVPNLTRFTAAEYQSDRIPRNTHAILIQATRVTFPKVVSDALNMQEGQKIVISQDQDATDTWYLCFDPEGFPITRYKAKSQHNSYVINSKAFCQMVLGCFALSEKSSMRFNLDIENPIQIDGLIYYKMTADWFHIEVQQQKMAAK